MYTRYMLLYTIHTGMYKLAEIRAHSMVQCPKKYIYMQFIQIFTKQGNTSAAHDPGDRYVYGIHARIYNSDGCVQGRDRPDR